MPDLPLVSPSQLTLFTECRRKWGFRYLEGIEPPKHPSAALGTSVHEQLGWYLTEGAEFDFELPSGEIANALRPLLPPPKTPGLVVEREVRFPSPSGKFAYRGFIDLYAPDSKVVPGMFDGPYGCANPPLVGDFKTTSNLKYAKTKEILKTDFQAQLYAAAVMVLDNVDWVDLVWFTVRTKRPYRAQWANLRANRSHVEEQFERIDAIGQELSAIKLAKPPVLDLPPNPRMCDQYGGCPHRHRCQLSPLVHAEAINEEAVSVSTAAWLESLKKSVPPAANPPPSTLPDPVSKAYDAAEREAIQNEEKLPDWCTAPVDPRHAPPAINPPESSLPPAPPVGVAAPVEEKKRRGRPPKSATPVPEVTTVTVVPSYEAEIKECAESFATLLRDLVTLFRAAK